MKPLTTVVGATGLLGGAICQRLAASGTPVRALVRPTVAPEKLQQLERIGVEFRHGDLKRPASLDACCEGAQAVISTASCMLSQQAGDSIQSVDLEGQLSLIEAARRAGVEHFVFMSFVPLQGDFPLQEAKRAVEQELKRSGMPRYTILRPAFFTEVWLGPALGFDPVNARARLYGTGQARVNWLSIKDVARFAVGALESPQASNATLEFGGEEALSQLEVVRLFEQWQGRRWMLKDIPEQAFRQQMDEATDPRQRSFSALMLNVALGCLVDSSSALGAVPIHFTGVSDYLRRVLAQQQPAFPESPQA